MTSRGAADVQSSLRAIATDSGRSGVPESRRSVGEHRGWGPGRCGSAGGAGREGDPTSVSAAGDAPCADAATAP